MSQFQNYQKASHRRKPVSRKRQKYWIALRLRLAAWKTALRVRLSPELQQQTFEIGSYILISREKDYGEIAC
jgi:hypothetical protein